MNKQISLSNLEDELSQVRTKKKEFLEQIERTVPWNEWVAMIKPCYYKGERGNKPYELELMLRLYLIQNLYNLDDEATVAEVTDSRAFSDFCGVESSNQIPDGDTLGRFRNLLVKNELQEKLFSQVVEQLTAKGLILKKGTIVDSTIIAAPTSTKNKERKRDSNAHQTRNGNATMMSELLTEEEEVVYGDSGYLGAEKREEAIVKNRSGKLIKYKLNRRPSQSKDNSVRSKAQIKRRERDKSSVRSKVEHVFGVVKGLLRYRKTRYKGLRKQTAKLNIMFALANLILADRPHLAA